MHSKKKLLLFLALIITIQAYANNSSCTVEHVIMSYAEDGCAGDYCNRSVIICVPNPMPADGKAPVVLAFHGRGNKVLENPLASIITDVPEAGMFGFNSNLHGLMSDKIVMYFQGLPVDDDLLPSILPGLVKDNTQSRGWQANPVGSNLRDNRDLAYVYKVVMANLNRIDPTKIFIVGHSSGSRFAGVLWNDVSTRYPNVSIKAIAFSAAQAGNYSVFGKFGVNLFPDSIYNSTSTS